MLKIILPALAALCLLLVSAGGASAAAATVAVDPASKTVDPNEEFTLTLKVHSDVDLGGAQTNIEFDRTILQVVDIAPAAPWSTAYFLIGVAPNNTKELAIADANNSTGKLPLVSTYYTVGSGSVPAGDADFVTLTMRAVAGGTSDISLYNDPPTQVTKAVDTAGNTVTMTATSGQVTVTGATLSPTPEGQTPTPTPTPSPTPAPTPTPSPTLPVQASLSVNPATLSVRPGAEFTLTIVQNSSIATSGAGADVKFDPSLLQLVSITKGAGYKAGSVVYGLVPVGGTPLGVTAKVAQANSTGTIDKVSAFLSPPASVAAGQAEVVTIKMKAQPGVSGTSAITLVNAEVIDSGGHEVGVAATNGSVTVSTSAPASLPLTGGNPSAGGSDAWLLLAGALAILTGGCAVFAARRRSQ